MTEIERKEYKTNLSIGDLIRNKTHLGHKISLLNPEMRSYVLGTKNGISIIDSRITHARLLKALNVFYNAGKNNKKILFVGTGYQTAELIKNTAEKCGQFYVNEKWLGGMLTNWYTVSKSIKTLSSYDKVLSDPESGLTKKETLYIGKKKDKLMSSFGGILNMKSRPDLVFVVNTIKDYLAIRESVSLGIPVVAIADTNSKVNGINYCIPGNSDSVTSIQLYLNEISNAILSGMRDAMKESGINFDKILRDKNDRQNKQTNSNDSIADSTASDSTTDSIEG